MALILLFSDDESVLLVATTNAIIQASQSRAATTDAVIQAAQAQTATTNAVIASPVALTASTDAVIQAAQTLIATTSAVIQAAQSRAATTDAVIQAAQTRTATTSAVIRAAFQLTASTSAVIADRVALDATTDAVIIGVNFRVATTSAVIQAALLRTASTSGVISDRIIVNATTNAVIISAPAGTGVYVKDSVSLGLGKAILRIMTNQPPTPQQFATLFSQAYEAYARTVIPTPTLVGRRQLMEAGLLAAFAAAGGSGSTAAQGLINAFTMFWLGTPVPGGFVVAFVGAPVMKAQLMATFKGPSTNQTVLAIKLAKILVSSTHLVQYVIGVNPPAFLA